MSELIAFIKNNKFFLLGLLILLGVVLVNLFPKGYVISSTDTSQIINIQDNFLEYFFAAPAWFLYLGLLYLLNFFSDNNTLNLSYTLGFFIFGAYFSFYIFSKLFFKTSNLVRSAFSLIYALNIFTLYTFTTHGLGYHCFYYLYIFIPLLIGFFIKFLQTRKFLFLSSFCLTLFLASPGFGNPAFALALVIVLFFLTILLLIVKKILFDRKLFSGLFFIIAFSFLVSAFWIFAVLPEMKGGVENLNSTNEINLLDALIGSGNQISDTLGLNNTSHDYFPFNFQYKSLFILKNLFIFLTYFPIILIGLSVLIFKKFDNKKIFFSLLAIFLLLIMGVAKIIPPFETINYFIFVKIWGMNTLRASDKIAIFLPFFLVTSLFVIFNNIDREKYKKLIAVVLFLLIITPLPFYLGKLQQTVGSRLSEGMNYKNSKLTFLVKIPDEYYSIKPFLDQQGGDFYIATLPNNLGWTGTGSSNYPRWKLNGVDPTQKIYGKKFIEPNPPIFGNWIFAQDFNDIASENNAWIIKLLGMMNSKYIIYHKDAPDDAVGKTLPKMRNLESRGLIKNLTENDYFILYEISPNLVLPYISYQKENFDIRGNIASIERNSQKIIEASGEASTWEINPKKFEINFENSEFSKNIILTETFNPLWKAYAIDGNGKESEIKNHFLARGYANGWEVPQNTDIEKIVIEYYPTRLMWRGMWISGITILFLITYLLRYYYKLKVIKSPKLKGKI